jgi:hypothetical protein
MSSIFAGSIDEVLYGVEDMRWPIEDCVPSMLHCRDQDIESAPLSSFIKDTPIILDASLGSPIPLPIVESAQEIKFGASTLHAIRQDRAHKQLAGRIL